MRLFLPVLIACSLALAACGDDEDTTTEPASGGSTPAATEEAPASGGGGITITMKDNTFTPGQATVKAGETVTFTNGGQISHNATGEGLESGTLEPGDTFDFTPSEAGTIEYVCTFHSGMVGTLTVE